MVNFTTKAPQLISAGGLSETLNLFLEKDELDRKILVLKDMHTQLENPEVVAKLKIIANLINQGIDGTVIIVSPVITIPPELEKYITILEMDYLSVEEIRELIVNFIQENELDEIRPSLLVSRFY